MFGEHSRSVGCRYRGITWQSKHQKNARGMGAEIRIGLSSACGNSSGGSHQLVGAADQFSSVDFTILFGKQTSAGTLEDGHEILQSDFRGIVRGYEIANRRFQVLRIHRRLF